MKSIGETIKNPTEKPKTAPPHELSAISEQIRTTIGFTSKYNRGYWLKLLKDSKMTDTRFQGLLKDIMNLPSKYNRGGFLTNILRKLKDKHD